jgi:hypothetical protein
MDVKLLPDAPLDAETTELAFIDGVPFVNAAKYEQVVDRHVGRLGRLDALRMDAMSLAEHLVAYAPEHEKARYWRELGELRKLASELMTP